MTTTSATTSSLGAFLEDSGCCRAAVSGEQQASSFQEHVAQAAHESGTMARAAASPPADSQAGETGSSSGTAGRQESQNGTHAMASQLSGVARVYSAAEAAAEQAGPVEVEDRSISAVREAMIAEGLDPDSVKMTYHTVDVWCPGGGWVNEMLLIETSDGRSLDFSARLSERSPEVTVCDVRHLLEGTGWAAQS